MKLFNLYNHNKLHSFLGSDLKNFELSIWLRMIGWSIISIFIPILMLSAGYSLFDVLIYEGVYILIDVPFNFLAAKLTSLIGARKVIIISTIAAICYFLVFRYLSNEGWLILISLAFFAAIQDSFYWVAHLYLFIESSGTKNEISKNNGVLSGINIFGGTLGPVVGSAILIFGNQETLLTITSLFLISSVIPLFWLSQVEDKPKYNFSFSKFFSELPEKQNFLTWFLYAIHTGVENTIWPIFIFTLFGSLKSIALITVIISISKIILSYIGGVVSPDKRNKFISWGVFSIILIWVVRLAFPNVAVYYASILFIGLCAVMIEVPLDSSIFERARMNHQSLASATYRNVIVMLPQGILFFILAMFIAVFKVSFGAAIGSLIILLIINFIIIYFIKKRDKSNNETRIGYGESFVR